MVQNPPATVSCASLADLHEVCLPSPAPPLSKLISEPETSRMRGKKAIDLGVVTGANNRPRRAALEHRSNLTRTRRPREQGAR
jgi:hypothetical protein